VGRNPDIKKVFRDILMGLDQEKYTYQKLKGLDEYQLMGKLDEFAKEKRYEYY
jgi:disease resistance protein RPM1